MEKEIIMRVVIYLIFIIGFLGFSQHTIVKPIEGSRLTPEGEVPYFKDVNNLYDKFVGDWKYIDPNNSNTYLEISILENPYRDSGSRFYDDVYLRFKYVENNQVIYDSSIYTEDELKRKINGTATDANNCSLFYREPTNLPVRYKKFPRQHGVPTLYLRHENELAIGGGAVEKLHWNVKFVLVENEVWPFKIPNNIILLRD